MGGAFVASVLASAGVALLSFFTGWIVSRLLGEVGRGQVGYVNFWLMTLATLLSGFATAMTYHASRRTAPDRTVVSTALTAVPVLGLLGVLAAQPLVGVLMNRSTDETRDLLRLFLWGLFVVLGNETLWALFAGRQMFRQLNYTRFAQPAVYLTFLAGLVATHRLTAYNVCLAMVASFATVFVVAAVVLVRETGVGPPSLRLARHGASYGLRLTGVAVGSLVTTRLDVLLLGNYVQEAQTGFYTQAVNLASMVISLFGALSFVIFPVASRDAGGDGRGLHEAVGRGLRLAMLGGTLTVGALALAAPWFVPWVYGEHMRPSVLPLWLLLPGVLAWCGNTIAAAALQSRNRPGAASIAQLVGIVLTIGGLLWSLPRWGIQAAAGTSTVAYAATFLVSLLLLRSDGSVTLHELLSPRASFTDVAWLVNSLRSRWGRTGPRGGDRDENLAEAETAAAAPASPVGEAADNITAAHEAARASAARSASGPEGDRQP